MSDCIINIEEPFNYHSNLIFPKRILADNPDNSLYVLYDVRYLGPFKFKDLYFEMKPRYIGISDDPEFRYKDHIVDIFEKQVQTVKGRFFRKMFEDTGLKPILKIIKTNLLWEDAQKLEIEYISKIGRINLGTGCLTNMTAGGDGSRGLICQESTKKLHSEIGKNKWKNPIYREKMCELVAGENNPRYGKKKSIEELKLISKNRRGMFLGDDNPSKREDVRKSISESLKGNKKPEEYGVSISESRMFDFKYIVQHEDGRVFEIENIHDFCLEKEIKYHYLSRTLKDRRQYKGFKIMSKEIIGPKKNKTYKFIEYKIIDETGIHYSTKNLKQFCRNFDISYNVFLTYSKNNKFYNGLKIVDRIEHEKELIWKKELGKYDRERIYDTKI